jgi:hypothetical protein
LIGNIEKIGLQKILRHLIRTPADRNFWLRYLQSLHDLSRS